VEKVVNAPMNPVRAASRHPPENPARVRISPERQQLIGVRTATVRRRQLFSSIRTVGAIAYDERLVTEVHTKIAGWVEKLYVDYVGKRVRRGQRLFSIYSPDLLSAQYEYRIALGYDRKSAGNRSAGKGSVTSSAAEAARRRLGLWDISDRQIARLARGGEPQRTLTIYSPFDGVVLERKAFPGQYLEPGIAAFKIGDLSRIWVTAEVFESEAQAIEVGQRAEVRFPYGQAGKPLEGRISFIYPDVDPQTRRVKVRLGLQNPGFELKPDSFVTVIIHAPAGEELAVPREAVIDTGTRQYALIALPGGYFEPRDIEVGPPGEEAYPVLKGLEEGDRVVTSAQFLIDSETNLRAAMQSMMGMHAMEGREHEGRRGTEGLEGAPEKGKPQKKQPDKKKPVEQKPEPGEEQRPTKPHQHQH
jgi:RND family efflux transporter MFP subunit